MLHTPNTKKSRQSVKTTLLYSVGGLTEGEQDEHAGPIYGDILEAKRHHGTVHCQDDEHQAAQTRHGVQALPPCLLQVLDTRLPAVSRGDMSSG